VQQDFTEIKPGGFVIGDINTLSKCAALEKVFDLGDKFICHPELAKMFGSVATKEAARVFMVTTDGMHQCQAVIVSMPDKHARADWAMRETLVGRNLAVGESWIFVCPDMDRDRASGVNSNLLKAKLRFTRTQVVIVPEKSEPLQGYFFTRRS
jgi:hypothetical protein